MKRKSKPTMLDIRKLVSKPKKIPITKVLKELELPKVDHKYGYFYSTIQQHMSVQEYGKFLDWMHGQTCALINGKVVCFVDDVIRFLKMVRHGTPTYWD